MAAVSLDLQIEQGATFSQTFLITGPGPDFDPADLTGFSARAQMRTAANSTAIVQTFTCSVEALTGAVTISLTAVQTTAIPTTGLTKYSQKAKFVYDVEIYQNDGYVQRIANGIAYVSPEVTK